MQKEVEIKIKITEEKTNLVKNWLKVNANYVGIYFITDYYFNNPKSSFYSKSKDGYTEIFNFLRVRITDADSFICFKNRIIDDSGNTLSVDEVETIVEDGNKAIEVFQNLGFSEITEIRKKREIFLYDDLFEFSLDKVDEMGEFLEIELKNYSGSVQDGKNLIYSLLKKIGLTKFVEFDRGYLTMFVNPKYYLGTEKKI